MIITAIINLLAGLGVFLIGFRLLSDNMEKLASGSLKKMFGKTANSKLAGVGIGAVSTAIVQSSSVTTVMVVGFVNAGLMSLSQATTVIMGANIGSTVTAQISALGAFDFVEYAMTLSVIGVFINMMAKKDNWKSSGMALAGLGLVFVGLQMMSNAMDGFQGKPCDRHGDPERDQSFPAPLFRTADHGGIAVVRCGNGDHYIHGFRRDAPRRQCAFRRPRQQYRYLRYGIAGVFRRRTECETGLFDPFPFQYPRRIAFLCTDRSVELGLRSILPFDDLCQGILGTQHADRHVPYLFQYRLYLAFPAVDQPFC